MNKEFQMPRNVSVSSSSSSESLMSLKGVTYYDLTSQNQRKILDETDQLVELVWEMRALEKDELYHHLR